jgi:tetratricopeptide (TPR) repeat protein
MALLEPPDTFYLSAAVGWYELGNLAEARNELTRLSPAAQKHPDVLEVRWMFCAHQKAWEEALSVAQELVEQAPKRASGWLHKAYALRRAPSGGLSQAMTALLPASEKFPREPTIPFNLACYACQLNQLDEARAWLKKALKVGGKRKVRAMALADQDLEPLWGEIKEL